MWRNVTCGLGTGDGCRADEGVVRDGVTAVVRGTPAAQDQHSAAERAAVEADERIPGISVERSGESSRQVRPAAIWCQPCLPCSIEKMIVIGLSSLPAPSVHNAAASERPNIYLPVDFGWIYFVKWPGLECVDDVSAF